MKLWVSILSHSHLYFAKDITYGLWFSHLYFAKDITYWLWFSSKFHFITLTFITIPLTSSFVSVTWPSMIPRGFYGLPIHSFIQSHDPPWSQEDSIGRLTPFIHSNNRQTPYECNSHLGHFTFKHNWAKEIIGPFKTSGCSYIL